MQELSPFWSVISSLSSKSNPIAAAIEVTNRCNAQCPYCYLPNHTERQELSTQQIHFIIDKLDNAGIFYVNITGGEPFLRNDISEILEHCFSCDFFFCSIFSNGTVITDAQIKFLEKYKKHIKPFRMTVFSHKEEIHDAYMKVPGALKKIIDTGKKLLEAGIDVRLSLSVMTFNIDHIETCKLFFQDQGFTIGLNHSKLISKYNDTPHIREMISEEFYRKVNSNYSNNLISQNLKRISSYKNVHRQLCRGIREMITIDVHGNIHPCTSFRNFIIGSILSDIPLDEILNGCKEYVNLKKLTIDDLVCKSCQMSSMCTPCLAHHHTTYNTLEGPYIQTCNQIKSIFSVGNDRGLL